MRSGSGIAFQSFMTNARAQYKHASEAATWPSDMIGLVEAFAWTWRHQKSHLPMLRNKQKATEENITRSCQQIYKLTALPMALLSHSIHLPLLHNCINQLHQIHHWLPSMPNCAMGYTHTVNNNAGSQPPQSCTAVAPWSCTLTALPTPTHHLSLLKTSLALNVQVQTT